MDTTKIRLCAISLVVPTRKSRIHGRCSRLPSKSWGVALVFRPFLHKDPYESVRMARAMPWVVEKEIIFERMPACHVHEIVMLQMVELAKRGHSQ
jgi:hypothetical protein